MTANANAARTLRGLHKLILGDKVEVYTRNGQVHLVNQERVSANRYGVTMTPQQARELGQDLVSYADEAENPSSTPGSPR